MADLARHPSIDRLLQNPRCAVAVSISGGKDSQAMLSALLRDKAERGWKATIVAVHADLGRIEWPQTPGHVAFTAAQAGVPLKVVRRRDGRGTWDMVDRWIERGETTSAGGQQGRPWSGPGKLRFCTSDMKRDPIDKYLREFGTVISVQGERSEESPHRATLKVAEVRTRIDCTIRTAWNWRPVLHWRVADVWTELGSSTADIARRQALYASGQQDEALKGWTAHPAYVMGNERLSCMFCVLGCPGDLQNAARQNPELHRELIAIEDRFGFTFQQGKSLRRFL